MDSVICPKNIPILSAIDRKRWRSVRSLCVFGYDAKEVIIVTDEEDVYCFGRNHFGALGLSHYNEDIDKPQINDTLSQKRVKNIYSGSDHWTALTTCGRIYTWGQNDFGQLATGQISETSTPLLVGCLTNEKIDQLSCGAAYTMALTRSGLLYGWGDNRFGQLGDGSLDWRWIPRIVAINAKVRSIVCGQNHSIALTGSGVFVWGLNLSGQLGRTPTGNDCHVLKPEPLSNFEGKSPDFQKAVCGPNYTLLLTTDGYVYGFGENLCGQIGDGSRVNQTTPHKISIDTKFVDIAAHNQNNTSIAVSADRQFYVWGLVNNMSCLSPKVLNSSSSLSIHDVFAIYAKTSVTFETIVLSEQLKTWQRVDNRDTDSVAALVPEVIHDFENCLIDVDGDKNEDICDTSVKSCEYFNDLTATLESEKTFDDLIDINIFPIIKSILGKQQDFRKAIRLLTIFGKNSSKVIAITDEDKAYVFGNNRFSSLCFISNEPHISGLKFNPLLSHKLIADISTGYEHCVALTSSGQCFSWGQNNWGQLGVEVGREAHPYLIAELDDKKVIQISCGGYHTLALTSDGKVYSWGENTSGQLGLKSRDKALVPTLIDFEERMVSISSGFCHSLAITDIGIVYVWGSNEFGQLGRASNCDYKPVANKWFSNEPKTIEEFKEIRFSKGVCGANHCLLLTTDGFVYAFGANTFGQIGNGSRGRQFTPFKISDQIKFKDIFSHFSNDLSMAVSTQNKFHVWGYVNKKSVLSPQLLSESIEESVFNVYAKYAKNKVTFKTVVISGIASDHNNVIGLSDGKEQTYETIQTDNTEQTISINEFGDQNHHKSVNNLVDIINGTIEDITKDLEPEKDKNGVDSDEYSSETIRKAIPVILAMNSLQKAFDNPIDSDLKLIFGESVIHCHKTILSIRNNKFYQKWNQTNDSMAVIQVADDRNYQSYYAFLQFLYGINPEINVSNVYHLMSISGQYDETYLAHQCRQYIDRVVTLSNVCQLYEKAITEGLPDLEKSCVEIAANNWKNVCKSDAFQAMDDKISKRFCLSVFDVL